MKKVIALILALIVLCNVCYAQENSSELKVLEEYKIFVGDEDGYRLQDNITKGEFVKMIAVASLYVDLTKNISASVSSDGEVVNNLKKYNDLTQNEWEYSYYLFLDTLGIEVSKDNTASHKENLTYTECYEYIIKILGYQLTDNGIQNAMKATQLGITKGLSVSINDYCTRENAVILLSNAINIPLCAMSSYDAESQETQYVILDGKDGRELRTLKTNLDIINQ